MRMYLWVISILVSAWVAFVWAERSTAAQGCDPAKIHCTNSTVYPIWQWDFTAVSGNVYTIRSSELAHVSGETNFPDTVIWLLNLDTGAVIAVDDDDNTGTPCDDPLTDYDCYDSKIVHVAATTFNARVIVAGYSDASHGTMSMSVLEGFGVELLPPALRQLQVFGGWRLVAKDVRAGDSLLAGALPGTYFGNRMYVFSTGAPYNCDQSCGSFQGRANSGVLGLSHVLMTSSWSSARIQIGSDTPYPVGTRFIHNRRSSAQGGGWSVPGSVDIDADGLTWEVEALLGTCDSETGPATDCTTCTGGFPANCPAGSCRCFGDRAGFDPSDTDNDGLDDLTEVFGREVSCAPLDAPFYRRLTSGGIDKCHDTTLLQCAPGQDCNSTFGIAMSALGADPREVDAFVEVDALASDGEPGFLQQTERDVIERIYGEEGFECSENESTDDQYCQGDLDRYRRVAVHVYDSDLFTPVTLNEGAGGVSFVAGWFVNHFASWRRYTNTFRYALGATGTGGQANAPGRRLIFGNSGGASIYKGLVFSHEFGHNLSLRHGGDEGPPKINYPSLMNLNKLYTKFTAKAHDPAMAPNPGLLWPSDFGQACSTDADCPVAGRCRSDTFTCHIRCWYGYSRFSRGLNETLDETDLTEDPVHEKLSAEVVCQQDGTANMNPFDATCNAQWGCKVNWDKSEDPPGTPQYLNGSQADLDDDGVETNTDVYDFDDWKGLYDSSWEGVDDDCCDSVTTWYCQMDGDGTDLSGFGEDATATGTVTFSTSGVATYDTVYGTSAYLDGPGSTDALVLPASALQSSIGAKTNGFGANGVLFSADINLRSTSFTGVHQILDARPFLEVYATNHSTYALLSATLHDGSQYRTVTIPWSRYGALNPNAWYRIFVWWDHAELRAVLEPWNLGTGKWDSAHETCVKTSAAKVADQPTGTIRLGQHRDSPSTRSLRGRIDEGVLMNYPPETFRGVRFADFKTPEDDPCN